MKSSRKAPFLFSAALKSAVTIFFLLSPIAAAQSLDDFLEIPEEPENFIDYNEPWRFKYINTSDISADQWKWWLTSTGSKRVCNKGEFNDDPETPHMCLENRLRKKPVILTAGVSWSSTYIVWIAAVLIRELLQVPVTIRPNVAGTHPFFAFHEADSGPRRLDPDVLNSRRYNFDGLIFANQDMGCSYKYVETLPPMEEFLSHEACQGSYPGAPVPNKCRPCQHAMLDVWGQEDAFDANSSQFEHGGALGVIGKQGWFISAATLDTYPQLVSWRGLSNPSATHRALPRVLTFGEYCHRLRKYGSSVEWDESTCNFFYQYHEFVDSLTCALHPTKFSDRVPEYKLCELFIITLNDLWAYAPFAASDACNYALCPTCPKIMCGVQIFYEGELARAYDFEESETETASAAAKYPLLGGYRVTGGEQGLLSATKAVAKLYGHWPTTSKHAVSAASQFHILPLFPIYLLSLLYLLTLLSLTTSYQRCIML